MASSAGAAAPDPEVRLGVEISLLVLLSLLWGGSFALIKIAVAAIPPLTIVAARVLAAALAAIGGALGLYRPSPGRRWAAFLVQGVLQSALPFALIGWGEQYIDSGLAGILNATPPLFVFLLTAFVTRHETVSGRELAGVTIGFAGVVLFIGVDALAGLGREVSAQVAMIAAAGSYACAAVHGRRFAALPPLATAASTMAAASVLMVPACLLVDRPWRLAPPAEAWLALAALALLSTALAMLIYFRLLRTLGSLGTASGGYLRAGVSVLFGVGLLGEPLTPSLASGLVLILAGVAAINAPHGRRSSR
jgi:drug/metabolite transporter (DMT)-like permease